ncbi:AraC family transcriptional regulator [Martelella endophytica]|uniref:AraC family transcriptional regulator n=1 Tax=Martelella endophytica TaxID=1486262 RepID=A0A0D5LSE6_MAREN|nr:AraC family transcriptional regulator [Martelella endophytica]AJY47006.1 AraC family transcriptional regulator [Martelella endophytica]
MTAAFETYQQRLMRVSDHINAHLDDELDFATLADIACLSPWHWHRIYRGVYGETIHATVKRLRLHRAAGELVNSRGPIADIAGRAGYGSVAAFTRQFKSTYGMAPAAYRHDGRHTRFDLPASKETRDMYDIELRNMKGRVLGGVAHRGSYMEVDKAFGQAVGLMMASGKFTPDMQMTGVYFDDPSIVAEKELRSFAGLTVPADADLPQGLERYEAPAGLYAVLTHKGPYAELHKAYSWFYGSWLPVKGHEPGDAPPMEVYLNNPREVAPEALLTEICVPLKG